MKMSSDVTSIGAIALLIEFVRGARIYREAAVRPRLPIVQNGPPGTFIVFPSGARVPLPTDQIILAEDSEGVARVGFGGMRFEGVEGGQLVFRRVRDIAPQETLSPERGVRMTLEPWMIASVASYGRLVWQNN
jgi:hypothetical protein